MGLDEIKNETILAPKPMPIQVIDFSAITMNFRLLLDN